MSWLPTVTVVGVVVLAALVWLFLRTRSQDLTQETLAKRRATSKIASPAALLEGPNRIPVVLSLAGDRIIYENPDLDAALELQNLEEIEYDDETATGHAVHGRVLRLRSHGHSFEFELDPPTAKQWEEALPAKHLETGHRQTA